jgi:ferric-dicitrate binding protein FerR (iron transport regulator)
MNDSALIQLGQALSRRMGEGPGADRTASQRLRFQTSIPRPRSRRIFLIPAAAALTLLLAGGLLSWHLLQDRTMPFVIEPGSIAGTEGQWVSAATDRESVIRFSTGSIFTLKQDSAARIISSNQEQVILDLNNGSIHCDVHHQNRTQWLVRAGTWRIAVTGTRFTVTWTSAQNTLNVRVEQGTVIVSGDGLTPDGMKLKQGDHLRVSNNRAILSHDAVAVSNSSAAGRRKDSDRPETAAFVLDEAIDKPASRPSTRSSAGTIATPPAAKTQMIWKQKYEQRDYSGALSAARQEGLARLIRTLDVDELWQLAQAARYARDGEAAKEILIGLRSRFPGSPRAGSALFLLGRVAMEIENDHSSARQWFEQYLHTAPHGNLAEEALGRLMDIHVKAGNAEAARQHARTYLSRYPDGSFAGMARSTLQ